MSVFFLNSSSQHQIDENRLRDIIATLISFDTKIGFIVMINDLRSVYVFNEFPVKINAQHGLWLQQKSITFLTFNFGFAF